MAFIDSGVWSLSIVVEDNNKNKASTSVWLPGALTEAEVQTRATALATAIQTVIDGYVSSFTVNRFYLNDAANSALPSSEVERKLVIPLGTAAHPNAVRISVPSPAFTLEQNFTDYADITDAGLLALATELIRGGITPGDGYVTYYGQDLTRYNSPFFSHRNRRPNK